MSTNAAVDSKGSRVTLRTKVRFPLFENPGIVITLGILGFITFLPLLMLLILSFKTEQQMADAMWLPSFPLRLGGYYAAFLQMQQPLVNSAVFVVGTVAISIFAATLCSYMFARYDAPGKEFLYLAILAMMMIPGVLTLITRFVVVPQAGVEQHQLGHLAAPGRRRPGLSGHRLAHLFRVHPRGVL